VQGPGMGTREVWGDKDCATLGQLLGPPQPPNPIYPSNGVGLALVPAASPPSSAQTDAEATVRGSPLRWDPSHESPVGSCQPGHSLLARWHRGRAQLLPHRPSCGEAALD